MEEANKPGVTRKSVAEKHGISPSSLNKWEQQLGRKRKTQDIKEQQFQREALDWVIELLTKERDKLKEGGAR